MDNKNKQIEETENLAIANVDPPSCSEIGETSRSAEEQPARIAYPWAGGRRCRVYTISYLHSKKIEYISGEVHCQKCERTYEMQFNVREKFDEITHQMHHVARKILMNPVRLNCDLCKEENSVSPVIPQNEQNINWLFLLLGQMIGFCSLEQLKNFCKHTARNRTGGKHVLLYRVYWELCRQLDPTDGFSL